MFSCIGGVHKIIFGGTVSRNVPHGGLALWEKLCSPEIPRDIMTGWDGLGNEMVFHVTRMSICGIYAIRELEWEHTGYLEWAPKE